MSFSQSCGASVVPLLSRLVLGAAFVTVGYNKMFSSVEYGPGDAAVLRSLDITVLDADGIEVASGAPWIQPAAFAPRTATSRQPASSQDDEGAITALPDAETAAGAQVGDPPVIELPEADPGDAVPAEDSIEPLPDGIYTSRGIYRVALYCHEAKWPVPVALAWIAGGTELVSSALLIVGFFTRVWGLGLAIAMGSAFYLYSMQHLGVHKENPFDFAANISEYNTVVGQLALFGLAFGVLLTGGGPVSIDHLLFRRVKKPEPASVNIVDAAYTPPYAQPAPAAPETPAPEERLAPPRPASDDEPPARRPL